MTDYRVQLSDMRTRITFQEPTITKDAGGAQKAGWTDIALNPTVWARWVAAHGQEVTGSEALRSSQRAVVTIRYRADVLPAWRVMKDEEAWEILSVDPVQDRNEWTELVVERVKGTV